MSFYFEKQIIFASFEYQNGIKSDHFFCVVYFMCSFPLIFDIDKDFPFQIP